MTDTDRALYGVLQELAGTDYASANYAGDIIESDMRRTARERGQALPTAGDVATETYHGAVVFDPVAGLHNHVSYPDYSALYPNIMRDLNASPETIAAVGDTDAFTSEHDVSDMQWSYIDTRPVKRLSEDETYSDYTDGEYKIVYDPSQNSIKWRDDWSRIQDNLERIYFVPHEAYEGLLASRADTYIRWNKSYEGTMYKATKRTRNSLYGVSGDSNFQLFDWRVAEAITIAGRLLLEYGADVLTERLQSAFDAEVYVTHGDTDGFGVAVDDPTLDRTHVLPKVQDATAWLNDTGMPEYVADTFGVPASETAHEVDLESYSPRLFIPDGDGDSGTKKTYAEHVTWDEGEECDEVSIKGFEAKRSDTANVTQAVQRDVLTAVLQHEPADAREIIEERVQDAVSSIESGDMSLADMGERSGMSSPPESYGSPDRSAHPTYRGAKYAKQHIDGEETFDKPLKFPVKEVRGAYPSRYDTDTGEDGTAVDYVSVEDPSNLPDEIVVDREQVVDSTLRQPLRRVLRTMGWSWSEIVDGEQQTNVTQFFQI